jgi:glutamate-1-semialdehyde 2,1-aminomutase
VATLGIPGSPGVPEDLARHTISLPFNDRDALARCVDRFGTEIAAVIVEPIPGNMGVIIPQLAFLEALRDMTRSSGALLIFDEVITGFRVAAGGAQELYGILPDLTCLGKIIGGGLPVGAYGGRRDIMERMAPEGDVYQAGTLSGNPLAMAAGLATLKILEQAEVYRQLDAKGEAYFSGLKAAARDGGVEVTVNRVGSMGTLFFSKGPVTDFAAARACDQERYGKFYRRMLDKGVYLAPSGFEAQFLSTAHGEDMIHKSLVCAGEAFRGL